MDKELLNELQDEIIRYTKLREHLLNIKVEVTKGQLERHIIDHFFFSRFDMLLKQAEYFIFEDKYVERAWKDMIALHYTNTTYTINPYVARIHFFTSKTHVDQEHYLGFITLRPVPEVSVMLSFIFPNFEVYKFSEHPVQCLTINKKVHIDIDNKNVELNIKTFPFFSQDGLVSVCVHADILMAAMYLNEKFGYKMIHLPEMQMFSHACAFPSDGLNYQEVLKIFDVNKIPARVYELTDGIRSKYLIKAFLESNFPVLLICSNHIICIIGIQYSSNDFEFIIYDDSGAFTKQENGKPGEFMKGFSWENLQRFMTFAEKDRTEQSNEFNGKICKGGAILTLIPERAYLSYMDTERQFVRVCKDIIFKDKFENGKKDFSVSDFYNLNPNLLLVEQFELKNFLNNHTKEMKNPISENQKRYLQNIYKTHYAWICWFMIRDNEINRKCLIIQDPTSVPQAVNHPIHLLFDESVDFSAFNHLNSMERKNDNV